MSSAWAIAFGSDGGESDIEETLAVVSMARGGRFSRGNTEFAPHSGTVIPARAGGAAGRQRLSASHAAKRTDTP